MQGDTILVILDALMASFAVIFAVHLKGAISTPSRQKSVPTKYRGAQNYALYRVVYTREFFTGWILITISVLLDLMLDLYKILYPPANDVLTFAFIIPLLTGMTGLYFMFVAFKKK